MYKQQYYFLISALPQLDVGQKPEVSFAEFKDMLKLNLSKNDMQQVKSFLFPMDLYNIRALWLGAELSYKGNFSAKELEDQMLVKDKLPGYLIEFLEKYESKQDRLRYFASLFACFFRDLPKKEGFLLKYLTFERKLRLVLLALRAKQIGKDLIFELQFEDPTDPFVAEIIMQKDSVEYFPPEEFAEIKNLFLENADDPQKLNLAILGYRFHKIEEMEENQDCSIDRVLAYLARLMLAESIAEQDVEKGKEQLGQYE